MKGKAKTIKHSVVPFAHAGIWIYIYYVLAYSRRTLNIVGVHAKKIFVITITKFA